MADRNRYNRRGRYQDWSNHDDRNWRDQEEQFSGEREQPEEGYGSQMSEPHRGSYGQRQSDYETGWDRSPRYGQRGSGYARGQSDYRSAGEYNYGPARFDQPGYRFDSFTSEDQSGRDFTMPTSTYSGGYPGYSGYGEYRAGGSPYGFAGDYAGDHDRQRSRGRYGERNRRDWWDRTSDEVMSWFGDEDAARRRQRDHSGRGPSNYTRSDDRIREDVNDNLTDDWAVDARNITVSVKSGEVTLDGKVSTRLQKRRAEDCAEDVSGVKHVQNNLRVQERSTWDRDEHSGTETASTGGTASTTTS